MSRTGPSGAARGPGDEERSKVGLGEYGLTATDLADAVHLAAVMKHATDTATRKRHGDFPAGETPLRDRPEEDAPTFTDKAERSSVRGGTARPRRRTGVEERRSSPAPEGGPMFSDTWGIAPFSQEELEERTRFLAALSPFNIKRPEGPENQVDREATARNYARALLDSVRWGENGEDEVLFLPSTGSRKRRAVPLKIGRASGRENVLEFRRVLFRSKNWRNVHACSPHCPRSTSKDRRAPRTRWTGRPPHAITHVPCSTACDGGRTARTRCCSFPVRVLGNGERCPSPFSWTVVCPCFFTGVWSTASRACSAAAGSSVVCGSCGSTRPGPGPRCRWAPTGGCVAYENPGAAAPTSR